MNRTWNSSEAVRVSAVVGHGITFDATGPAEQPPPRPNTWCSAQPTERESWPGTPRASSATRISAARTTIPLHSSDEDPRCERAVRPHLDDVIGTSQSEPHAVPRHKSPQARLTRGRDTPTGWVPPPRPGPRAQTIPNGPAPQAGLMADWPQPACDPRSPSPA